MIVNSETDKADSTWPQLRPKKGAAENHVQTFIHRSVESLDMRAERSSLSRHLALLTDKLIEAKRSLTEICVWLSLPLADLLDLIVFLGLPTPHDRRRRQYQSARFWTDAQISLLLKLWLTDVTIDDLVLRIGRPRKSVLTKARQFRLLVRERAALQAKAAGSAQAMLPSPLSLGTTGLGPAQVSSAAIKPAAGDAAGHAESCSSAQDAVQPAQTELAFVVSSELLTSLNGLEAAAEVAGREITTAPRP